ncbi:MAG: Uma2 family endonuclease [Saprospiraceae bacterium]|nr:Uma2 family endonuclease [Lewinella sp.]
MITNINQLDLNKRYTYEDYLSWRLEEAVELIRGKIFRMSPAPNMSHQWISSELRNKIYNYLKGKPYRSFAAPFDVRLPLPPHKQQDEVIDTVVQPDISVICDLSKLDRRGCLGAPDWIIEILSNSTSKKDLTDKFDIYQHAGVKEYWVVYPHEGTVIAYRLDDKNTYQIVRPQPFVKDESVPVGIFPDFSIDLEGVFPEGFE